MSMILKSNATISSSNSSGSSSSSDQAVHSNGDISSTDIGITSSKSKAERELSSTDDIVGSKVEKEVARFSLSSKCLVEQLPNTLSVSFRGRCLLFSSFLFSSHPFSSHPFSSNLFLFLPFSSLVVSSLP